MLHGALDIEIHCRQLSEGVGRWLGVEEIVAAEAQQQARIGGLGQRVMDSPAHRALDRLVRVIGSQRLEEAGLEPAHCSQPGKGHEVVA